MTNLVTSALLARSGLWGGNTLANNVVANEVARENALRRSQALMTSTALANTTGYTSLLGNRGVYGGYGGYGGYGFSGGAYSRGLYGSGLGHPYQGLNGLVANSTYGNGLLTSGLRPLVGRALTSTALLSSQQRLLDAEAHVLNNEVKEEVVRDVVRDNALRRSQALLTSTALANSQGAFLGNGWRGGLYGRGLYGNSLLGSRYAGAFPGTGLTGYRGLGVSTGGVLPGTVLPTTTNLALSSGGLYANAFNANPLVNSRLGLLSSVGGLNYGNPVVGNRLLASNAIRNSLATSALLTRSIY